MTRVVITGMGAVTPLGSSVAEFVTGLRQQRVGFRPISTFDPSATGVSLAGEAADFDPLIRLRKKRFETNGPFLTVCCLFSPRSF
ncbi:hypothetical protein OAL24_00938 [Oenococcus sicerae]|nr:hypothetical protein OAL24_00938 [Oenococcus sicerae]